MKHKLVYQTNKGGFVKFFRTGQCADATRYIDTVVTKDVTEAIGRGVVSFLVYNGTNDIIEEFMRLIENMFPSEVSRFTREDFTILEYEDGVDPEA